MKRVMIVDNHEVVRSGVIRVINRLDWEYGEAATGSAAMKMVREQPWDLIVLDLSLGEQNGLEVLREVKKCRPSIPVLILTMHVEEQYARRALRAGASGYVTKNATREELLKAVQVVMEGGVFLDSEIGLKISPGEAGSDDPVHRSLSARELQVMSLIGSGKTVSEIAVLLKISDKTVSTYRTRILEKMKMRTNVEIIRYAIRNGLAN